MATVLMLAVGAAVDVGRWLHARDQTVAAVDAALLAGGRQLQTDSGDQDSAVAAAQKLYAENTKSRLPVVGDSISFAVGNDGISMVANGTAYIQTPFLQIANINRLPLIAEGQQPIAQAQLAVTGGNGSQIQSLEISVMLDVTGSMAGQKLQDLKDSASDLLNIVLLSGQNNLTVKVGIVPFSEDIRLPNTAALNKARGTSNLPSTKSITTGSGWSQTTTKYYLSDCVVERAGNEKYTDAAPASGQYVMAHYTTSSSGGKGKCTVPKSGRDCTVDERQELTPYDRIEPEGSRWHGRPPRHGLGLVPVVAELGVPLAIEHARALRHRNRTEDRNPDDRWRVQHAVRLERHLGEPGQVIPPARAPRTTARRRRRARCARP